MLAAVAAGAASVAFSTPDQIANQIQKSISSAAAGKIRRDREAKENRDKDAAATAANTAKMVNGIEKIANRQPGEITFAGAG